MRRSSSPVRFPFVLSSSMAMRSIVCRARGEVLLHLSGLRMGGLAEVKERRMAQRQDERREVDVGQRVFHRSPSSDCVSYSVRPPTADSREANGLRHVHPAS